MSLVPSRSLSPDRALDSDEADIGEGRRVPGWESEDRITQEPGRPNSEVLKPSSSAYDSIKSFSKNIYPFSKKTSLPLYTSIELGNITHISSTNSFPGHDLPPEYAPRRGWTIGIKWACGAAFFVLIFNSLFLGTSYAKHGAPNGVGTLFKGDCAKAHRMDSGIHVVINLMGAILLGASNYVLQILGAPTRRQVDEAHSRKISLYIGVPNLRNMRFVGFRRVMLWVILVVSALPLHLFWNSAVFSTLESNQYDILLVSSDFINSDSFNCKLDNVIQPGGTGKGNMDNDTFCDFAKGLYDANKAGNLQYLDNLACMKAYSVDLLEGRRNLLAVSKDTGDNHAEGTDLQNGSIFGWMPSSNYQESMLEVGGSGWLPNSWLCSSPLSNASYEKFVKAAQRNLTFCDSAKVLSDPANLKLGPKSLPIDHCLSERIQDTCELHFIVSVMVIVIVCNAIKFACMLAAIFVLNDRPLVVIGDAIASFLEHEDDCTRGDCLAVAHSKKSQKKPQKFEQRRVGFWSIKQYQLSSDLKSRMWTLNQNRWFTAPKAVNWILCIILCLVFLLVASLLLNVGITSMLGTTFSSLQFSSPSPSTLITWFDSSTNLDVTSKKTSILLLLVTISNAPQLLFSILYFLYNTIYTSMLSAYEILKYFKHRKTLRVSYPTGFQRSTYWLQLPLRYSVPLLTCSGFLHYLISRSLFIARISFFDARGEPVLVDSRSHYGRAHTNMLTLPGYSPKAIIASIVLGAVMLLTLIGMGLRKFDAEMPTIGNDSWAISAACHSLKESQGISGRPLIWGVVGADGDTGLDHCSFTSENAKPPVVGQMYA